jgi:tape measure domain-containing protein
MPGGIEVASLAVEVDPKGIKETSSQLGGLSKSGKEAELSMGGFAKSIVGYTTAANLAVDITKKIITGVKDLAVESVQLAAGFETARVTWGVLMGDMAVGEDVFNKIRQFSAETPLSFQALESSAQTLAGFGVEAGDLINVLGRLGDLARGDNSALGRLSLVFGQVKAQGRAMTQDLYQFVNAGVPIFNMLADSMDVDIGKIKDLAADGKIGFAEIEEAIRKATSEGGQFYEMLSNAAKLTAGKMSTAMDNFKQSLAALGEKFLPLVNAGLDAYNRHMEEAAGRKNVESVLSGESGDISAAIARLITERDQIQAQLIQAQAWLKQTSDFAYSMQVSELENSLNEIETQINALYSRQRNQLVSDAGAGKLDPVDTVRTWQDWEKEVDEWTRLELEKVDTNKRVADLLNRSYDAAKARDEVIDQAIDKLLGLTTDQTTEKFNTTDRSIQELVRQKSAFDVPDLGLDFFSDLNTTNTIGNVQALTIGLTDLAVAAADASGEFKILSVEEIKAAEEAEKEKLIIENLKKELESIAQSAAIDTFKSIGAALAAGSEGAETFEDAMLRMSIQILNQLPLMMLSAGLQLIAVGNWPVGLALIAASGLVAIGAGAASYGYDKATSPVEANAFGNAYQSPSLSAYSGGVYNSPRMFAFANGAGMFAEKGWEGILPLARMSTGKLGVHATGGGGDVQVIINNNATNTTTSSEEKTGADGSRQVIVTIESIVQGMVPKGKLDGLLSRGGMSPVAYRG